MSGDKRFDTFADHNLAARLNKLRSNENDNEKVSNTLSDEDFKRRLLALEPDYFSSTRSYSSSFDTPVYTTDDLIEQTLSELAIERKHNIGGNSAIEIYLSSRLKEMRETDKSVSENELLERYEKLRGNLSNDLCSTQTLAKTDLKDESLLDDLLSSDSDGESEEVNNILSQVADMNRLEELHSKEHDGKTELPQRTSKAAFIIDHDDDDDDVISDESDSSSICSSDYDTSDSD